MLQTSLHLKSAVFIFRADSSAANNAGNMKGLGYQKATWAHTYVIASDAFLRNVESNISTVAIDGLGSGGLWRSLRASYHGTKTKPGDDRENESH